MFIQSLFPPAAYSLFKEEDKEMSQKEIAPDLSDSTKQLQDWTDLTDPGAVLQLIIPERNLKGLEWP